MGTKQLTVKVDAAVAEQAHRYAGGNMSAYAAAAIRERVLRDAAAEYRQMLAANPDFAAEIHAAERWATSNAEVARQDAWTGEAGPGA